MKRIQYLLQRIIEEVGEKTDRKAPFATGMGMGSQPIYVATFEIAEATFRIDSISSGCTLFIDDHDILKNWDCFSYEAEQNLIRILTNQLKKSTNKGKDENHQEIVQKIEDILATG